MNLKSFLKRLFGGEVIEKIHSPFNGEILVVKELSGRTIMRVGGITQSGGMVEDIWRVALAKVQSSKFKVQSCLVLGLGCGTVVKLLTEKWPGIKITGIEIDPEVIKIGKKYFGLEEILGLKVIVGDAIKAVSSQSSVVRQKKFDLILIDMYQGQEIPKETEDGEFLNGLKKLLNKDGLIIFNRLYFGKHKKETKDFTEKLNGMFSEVSTHRTEFNLFIFCRSISRD